MIELDGYRVINSTEYDFAEFAHADRLERKTKVRAKRKKFKYLDLVCAFDIETTRIPEIEQSLMYIWQFAVNEKTVIIGRTWVEYLDFCRKIRFYLEEDEKVKVWVHNLSYEFHFLRGVIDFRPEDVFAVQSRKILKAEDDRIEYCCSYLHSNMSLKVYADKMQTVHKKLPDYHYSKARYPWTPLTAEELHYCTNDVICLVEAIKAEMTQDGDDLYTIPATSTGYVRRDVKAAMKKIDFRYVPSIAPDELLYILLKEAFRGGNCHANRYFAGEILKNVHSADRSSSYPDVLINCEFPIRKFYKIPEYSLDELLSLWIGQRHKAALFRLRMKKIRLKKPFWGCPYLAKAKCRNVVNATYDNGRILSADYLETTITDVDLKIIMSEYDFEGEPYDIHVSTYGQLPKPLKEEIIKYYKAKTELKGVDGEEVYYMKAKNKLNSIYGMMVTDAAKPHMLYQPDESGDELFVFDPTEQRAELIETARKRAFVAYQWGVWCTAWARYRLEEGIELAHGDILDPDAPQFIYTDTDCVKYTGVIDWCAYNSQRIADSKKNGAYAVDAKGKTHYMGVFEPERSEDRFKTLGAKKYAAENADGLEITIAGVGKKSGAKELAEAGGLEAFVEGFIFSGDAAGLEARYNDDDFGPYVIDGHEINITANVCLRPSTYELGLTGDYKRIIEMSKNQLILALDKSIPQF